MPAGYKIRDLVELVWDLAGGPSVTRLCQLRDVGGRSRSDKCGGLARSYRGDFDALFVDLLKTDLVALLRSEIEIDGSAYCLPDAARYAKDDLIDMALAVFRDGIVPDVFAELVDDDDDEDGDVDDEAFDDLDDADEDDVDDAEEDDAVDVEEDEHDPCGALYHARFLGDFTPGGGSAPARPYQIEAIAAIRASLTPGARPLLHVATGGGKTFIANDVVAHVCHQRGESVFWVTKDWRLLYQAAQDLSRRHGLLPHIARLGGDGKALHPLPDVAAPIRYTTIQTLARRLRAGLLDGVGLVVWDECHWGEHGKTGRRILKHLEKRRVPVLGLTATPRPAERSTFHVVYSKTFWDLVREGYLAKPVIEEPVPTNVRWVPDRAGSEGDFRKGSLVELAQNARRNRIIVDHYVANAGRYGQTILFACNMEHATRLAKMLEDRGVAARAIHSDNDDHENRDHLEAFRSHRVTVATNVEMLTHGIDVPSVRTVLLTRPTLSDILYSQMIGRASRLDPASGKRTFNVVEFTDNLERFGEDLKTAKTFFAGAPGATAFETPPLHARPRSAQATDERGQHRFDPNGSPTWIPNDPSVPEAMRGLWFRKGQTFGFEVELTRPGLNPRDIHGTAEWTRVAQALRGALELRLAGRVAPRVFPNYEGISGDKSYAVWNVEYDGSVGWEVTSRVLSDEAGYREVVDAGAAIEAVASVHDLVVNHRTGLHVHLAWQYAHPDELRRFIRLVRLFEPGLASLVPPSRVAAFENGRYDVGTPNRYCRPISTVLPRRVLDVEAARFEGAVASLLDHDEARFTTVNLVPLGGPGTVEIRMHSGTVEPRKMLLWLSLWQQLLWAAGTGVSVPGVPDRDHLEPDVDIVALAREFLPAAGQPQQQAFLRKLADRRAEVVAGWASHPELSAWTAHATRW